LIGLAAIAAACPVPTSAGGLPKVRMAADGRGFQADGKPFVPMGINYYRPGTGWAPQVWKQFDAEATRRDFARMKALGVNCVRVFLSHGSFQMEPNALSPDGLARFDQFLAIAEEAGIYVHPTGPDHWEGLPDWAKGDRVADEQVLSALENFWRLFGRRYRGRTVIFAYDLRNEPSVAWDSPAMPAKWNRWLATRYGSAEKTAQAWHVKAEAIRWGQQPAPPAKDAPGDRQLLDYQEFRESLADDWTGHQTAVIKRVDPEALVTVGLLQTSVPAAPGGVQHYSAFRPQRQARLLDFLEVHFYPGMLQYTAEAEQRNLSYLESVVRAVAEAGKPVVVAEFGWYGGGTLSIRRQNRVVPYGVVSEPQQAQWCRKLIETTQGLATGWLNWGFYDHPQANDCSQRTGLLTVDGKPKAWAGEFQRLAGALSGKTLSRPKLGPRPTLDWDRCRTSSVARREFREAYDRAFQADRGRQSK
jgi:hypothetical protein